MRRPCLVVTVSSLLILFSCKKESNAPPVPDSPRLGTKWTYQYKTFDGGGMLADTYIFSYRATNEVNLGGETWLNITDSLGATFFMLRLKPDGLYQYANNNAQLLCKDPATVGESYISYNDGADETFTVYSLNTLINLPYPTNNVYVNIYNGEKAGILEDIIWYNKDLWIGKMEKYAPNIFGVYHRSERWELISIEY